MSLLTVYTCEECGREMLGAICRRYCINCRKFHDKKDMMEYINTKYNLVMDSNPKRFNFDRQCRWTCKKCNHSFRKTYKEIMDRQGCEICVLLKELEIEKDILKQLNETDRKKLINRYPMSYGENVVKDFLDDLLVDYEQEYRFPDFEMHPFDFYIPELKLCIEYDGRQHIEPCTKQGGKKGLQKRMRNDKLRNDYCWENDLSLIRLTFLRSDDENIKLLEDEMLKIKKEGCKIFIGYEVSLKTTKKQELKI